jgi:hypothetical protein
MSLSNLKHTGHRLEDRDASSSNFDEHGLPASSWQERLDSPDDATSNSPDKHESEGWNPFEIWHQRIKRKSEI